MSQLNCQPLTLTGHSSVVCDESGCGSAGFSRHSTPTGLISFSIRSSSLEPAPGGSHSFEFQPCGGVFLRNGIRFFTVFKFIAQVEG